jgi:integrase
LKKNRQGRRQQENPRLNHLLQNRLVSAEALTKFIKTAENMNKATADEYKSRLRVFERFVVEEYHVTVDDLISALKNGSVDAYEVLDSYVRYLQRDDSINHNGGISTLTIKQRVTTAKNLLEYNDVDISPRKFELKVKLPKVVKKERKALSKNDIIEILNSCSDIRLKTYVMLLAGTGMRAVEALSTRITDYDFKSNPANVFVRGKYTKTKVDRFVLLTDEIVKQMKTWIQYKYRTRRISRVDPTDSRHNTIEYRTPAKKEGDLVFSLTRNKNDNPLPDYVYHELADKFGKTLDRIPKWSGKREEGDHGRRRPITLHSLRRYVKSTISDLGYGDFSESMVGHSTSTYYRRTDTERADLFRKIEPNLTFLDYTTLERRGADVQSKVEQVERENLILRQRDSMNTDAISNLSDQLSKVMQEIEIIKKNNNK